MAALGSALSFDVGSDSNVAGVGTNASRSDGGQRPGTVGNGTGNWERSRGIPTNLRTGLWVDDTVLAARSVTRGGR